MKAIVQDAYGPPEVLALEDIDKPAVGDEEVLIRVRAAGVDPGIWHFVTGLPYLVRLMGGLGKPKARVPSGDVAGRVEAVGRGVAHFRPGDEVFGACHGSFAEYARAREDKIALKPGSIPFEQATAVFVSGVTALQALRDRGQVKRGQHVLIVGAAGGVGTFAVQIAKTLAAEVTGVCSTAKTDLVRALGADHAIDYTREDFTDGSRRYDVIVDTAGNRPLSRLRRALAPRGTLVLVGGEGGGRWLGGMGRFLRALILSPLVSQALRPMIAAGRKEDLLFLKGLLEAGKVAPVIDRTYPLSEAAAAVRYVGAGRAQGKVVITV